MFQLNSDSSADKPPNSAQKPKNQCQLSHHEIKTLLFLILMLIANNFTAQFI